MDFGVKPFDAEASRLGLRDIGDFPPLDKAERVPYLIAEIAALLAEGIVVDNIVAGGSCEHDTHADTIGAKLIDQFEGVGGIAERFRHLSAQLIAHDTGEIDISERHLAGELIARHDHTRHPEEDDIGGGNKIGSGIIILELLIVGIEDAVE